MSTTMSVTHFAVSKSPFSIQDNLIDETIDQSLLTATGYDVIDAFLSSSETLEQTLQRRTADDVAHQAGLAAQRERTLRQTNLARQNKHKRRCDEIEAEINEARKRRVLDVRPGIPETRTAAQAQIRTDRNHRMFCIRENAILINDDGSDYPNPKAQSRPHGEDDLLSDKLEGMKIIFFVHHGTNEEVAESMIKESIPAESKARKEMMRKLKAERGRLQHRLFQGARAICKGLTLGEDFAALHDLSAKKVERIHFFKAKATKERVATFYSHVASAVNLSLILYGDGQVYATLRKFMQMVFVRTMEDLWYYELHHDNSFAPLLKKNQKIMFGRFQKLTDSQDGLKMMKDLPSHLDIPVTPDFPRRHQTLKWDARSQDDDLFDSIVDGRMPNHDDSL